jgi:hypothetical protein
MWHWDQGRLAYFQFDSLRQIASFVVGDDFKTASKADLLAATGLPFAAPATHSAWRNYSRILKLCLLVSEINNVAQPTPIATLLSRPGVVTCDEYLHFLTRAFTEPSPALEKWSPDADFRYPLLYSLKYLLTKVAINGTPTASFEEIIGGYIESKLDGSEDAEAFIEAVGNSGNYENAARNTTADLRQAKESLRVIAQISYLHIRGNEVIVSLNPTDAHDIFDDLRAIIGPRERDREDEIQRLGNLFRDGFTDISFDYPNTIVDEVVESGFQEGGKVKKTHLTIERNSALRREFFLIRPTAICDICTMDTRQTYPWTERVIDLHHLLPLSSGTRVEAEGTTLDDLVAVCPSCHRAIHRFYDFWLRDANKSDFADRAEAKATYDAMKAQFPGVQYA